ncbi:unnamed protein product [Clonostachys rhizophaga]|uniref:Uncharacterized protein n=1 Tax=Clonostachys rhizophaga TaxID=160324 RepID=A0A9N9UW46_9HYPO|nr:unnamed protein product [Clonostachys rhizophaga]
MELRSLLDTGNKLGHLVSKSAIDEMGLWPEVNRNNIRTGTTLTGRLETLGSIDLDYYLGDNRNCFTDTFHIFDDWFYKNHDVLFSPGTENNNLVGMVAFDKHGETEDERTMEWERERRREEEIRQEAERLRTMQQQREEQERRNEARRRREREQATRSRED